ncbi:MAG: hypothetical protein M3437_14690, partial [Chloroflexota bacterium]|nr:hypothetical protein [Chloroflexota bacterium]
QRFALLLAHPPRQYMTLTEKTFCVIANTSLEVRSNVTANCCHFVYHTGEGMIAAVTQLYEQWSPRSDLLALLSSWISHLLPAVMYCCVVSLGCPS